MAVANVGSFDAYQVNIEDLAPTGLINPAIESYSADCDQSSSLPIPFSDSENSGGIFIENLIIDSSTTCTITISFEVADEALFGDTIVNVATADFTSSPNVDATPFSTVRSNEVEIDIALPTVMKTFPDDGNSDSSNSAYPNLLPGESDNFQFEVCFPKGSSEDFIIQDVDLNNRFINFDASDLTPPGAIVACVHDASLSSYAGFPDICFTAGGPNLNANNAFTITCLLYTSPSPRDKRQSRMPSSA